MPLSPSEILKAASSTRSGSAEQRRARSTSALLRSPFLSPLDLFLIKVPLGFSFPL